MVMRASKGNTIRLIPDIWRGRMVAEGWRLHEPLAGDPEVTVPTLLSEIDARGGPHAPAAPSVEEAPRRRGRG